LFILLIGWSIHWKNEQLCKQIVWKYDSPKNATYEI
jgi:hypothetical protein